tara:strand:+ start:501 stop:716 length:216 start_codon:yes stop_codon:yes gene_type:complete
MFPKEIMSYIGLLFLLLGLVFAVMSAVDIKTPDKLDISNTKTLNTYFSAVKMNNLALTVSVIGAALFIGSK